MSRRALVIALAVLALLATTTMSTLARPSTAAGPAPTAPAASQPLDGQPGLTQDSPTGYYLWHDSDGLHLRTHGPGHLHDFAANLHTDGVFTDVDTVRLESRDHVAILDGGHTLALRFHTYDATDGVNFRIHGGTRLRLALGLDGHPISTHHIYLGPDGHHPASNPFTIHR